MKSVHRLVATTAALCLVLLVSGCGGGGDGAGAGTGNLVGTWVFQSLTFPQTGDVVVPPERSGTITFQENNDFWATGGMRTEDVSPGTWQILPDGRIMLMVSGFGFDYTYSIAGDTLTMVVPDVSSNTIVLVRQDNSAAAGLVGAWLNEDGDVQHVFNADGTCVATRTSGEEIGTLVWITAGSQLTIIYPAGISETVTYSVSGNTLTLTVSPDHFQTWTRR